MKKSLAVLLAIVMCFSMTAFAAADEADAEVMSYDEYVLAEVDAEVVVDMYVSAVQKWYDGKITVYAADPNGAYFVYGLECAEEDVKLLVPGTKIRVTGYKAEWAGEIEITDASFEVLDGCYYAEAVDVTNLMGTSILKEMQNRYVTFSDFTVAASKDGDGKDVAFLYKWDGSGSRGDDLYFNVSKDGMTYTFTVESSLCDEYSDVYKTVEALNIGDEINMSGYLYWYEGANPHITSVKKEALTYPQYLAAEVDDEVAVEVYVQAAQKWKEDKVTVYAADEEGAYFIYGLECTEEEAALLVPGAKIRVEGFIGEWAGEREITDATFEMLEGNYIAETVDVTALLDSELLIRNQNRFVSFSGMTVEASKNGDGKDVAFLYKWDGSGSKGDDLYFNVSKDGVTYTFTVESSLCDENSDVYKTVEALNIGDEVNMNGFLYWYEGLNPHITTVRVGALTHFLYEAAEIDDEVTIETTIQAAQALSKEETITLYTADENGAYFIYGMPCTPEEAKALVPGTKIRVTGFKSEWAGEIEITDATCEIIGDNGYMAEAVDVTELLGSDKMIRKQNQLAAFKGLTVAPSQNAEGKEAAFLYKWNGAGAEGDDLYFSVTPDGENFYTFLVESSLCDKNTEVYKAVQNLQIGDCIDLEGFLYWYEDLNPHIISVVPAADAE